VKGASKYYLLAFLEGVGVIAVELLSAKILAPYFGTSLLIWTMVIGITLLALAGSYAIGGHLSKTTQRDERLFMLFAGGALLLALMPLTGPLLFRIFSGLPLLLAVSLCTALLLVPPIMLMAATTPMLIQGIAQEIDQAGRVSGNVYAMSTSGGILTTFGFGFYVIPELGISKPSFFAGALILVAANFLLPKLKPTLRIGLSAGLLLPALLIFLPSKQSSGPVELVFEQEGVLGQVKVIDVDAVGDIPKTRKLLFNGIPQTNMLKGDYTATSHFNYVHVLASLSSMKPAGAEALICGLGAGSLVMEYARLGFKTDVVDIDWRLPSIGERYFYLDPSAYTFYVDDARHFIHQSAKQYDIITLDIALSEAQPYHLYTVEAFREFKEKLKPDGILITNFQGHFFGKHSVAERSIFKTMQAAGFEVFAIPSVGKGIQDIIYVASPQKVPFEDLSIRRLSACCITIAHADVLAKDPRSHVISNPDLRDAFILEDDRPMLDLIRLPSVMEFRSNKINNIADKELESQGKLFK
jgi:spermidine synthase